MAPLLLVLPLRKWCHRLLFRALLLAALQVVLREEVAGVLRVRRRYRRSRRSSFFSVFWRALKGLLLLLAPPLRKRGTCCGRFGCGRPLLRRFGLRVLRR